MGKEGEVKVVLNSGSAHPFEALFPLQIVKAWTVSLSNVYFMSIIAVLHVPNWGLLTLKLTVILSDEFAVLFCGLIIVILGGIVPGTALIWLKMKNGLAFATSTACIPATVEIKKAKMITVAMNDFLLIAIK